MLTSNGCICVKEPQSSQTLASTRSIPLLLLFFKLSLVSSKHSVEMFLNNVGVLLLRDMLWMPSTLVITVRMGTLSGGPNFCDGTFEPYQTSLPAVYKAARKAESDRAGYAILDSVADPLSATTSMN